MKRWIPSVEQVKGTRGMGTDGSPSPKKRESLAVSARPSATWMGGLILHSQRVAC